MRRCADPSPGRGGSPAEALPPLPGLGFFCLCVFVQGLTHPGYPLTALPGRIESGATSGAERENEAGLRLPVSSRFGFGRAPGRFPLLGSVGAGASARPQPSRRPAWVRSAPRLGSPSGIANRPAWVRSARGHLLVRNHRNDRLGFGRRRDLAPPRASQTDRLGFGRRRGISCHKYGLPKNLIDHTGPVDRHSRHAERVGKRMGGPSHLRYYRHGGFADSGQAVADPRKPTECLANRNEERQGRSRGRGNLRLRASLASS